MLEVCGDYAAAHGDVCSNDILERRQKIQFMLVHVFWLCFSPKLRCTFICTVHDSLWLASWPHDASYCNRCLSPIVSWDGLQPATLCRLSSHRQWDACDGPRYRLTEQKPPEGWMWLLALYVVRSQITRPFKATRGFSPLVCTTCRLFIRLSVWLKEVT